MASENFGMNLEFKTAACLQCSGNANVVVNHGLGVMVAKCPACGWNENGPIIDHPAQEKEPTDEQQ
jgi:hypothetical protein